ncbi:MAG: hypothetical protein ACI8XC_002767 [Gammaproteobacteria bacterium]|jgi:hypothetical protein
MASIPPKFTDLRLEQSLVTARSVIPVQNDDWILHSGIKTLDQIFQSSKSGDLIEWGIPPGLNGRLIPLQFLKKDIPASVWIYHHQNLSVFASSWISHGVNLDRLFFIGSDHPVKQLRPLFLDDCFQRIIIDSPRLFSTGDMAFVSHQARKKGVIVFLIRRYFLSAKRGNPYASLRLNAWQNSHEDFVIQTIKAHATRRHIIRRHEFLFDERLYDE